MELAPTLWTLSTRSCPICKSYYVCVRCDFDDRWPLWVSGFDVAGPLLRSATHEADCVVFFLVLLRFEGYHVVLSFADVSPAVCRKAATFKAAEKFAHKTAHEVHCRPGACFFPMGEQGTSDERTKATIFDTQKVRKKWLMPKQHRRCIASLEPAFSVSSPIGEPGTSDKRTKASILTPQKNSKKMAYAKTAHAVHCRPGACFSDGRARNKR